MMQKANSEHDGMTARVLKYIFSYRSADVTVSFSFIEIYNEQAYDLNAESQREPYYRKGKILC